MHRTAPDRTPAIALGALLLLVVVLYARGLGHALVYDDPMLVGASRLSGALGDLVGVWTWDLWGSTTQAQEPTSGYYRPLFLLSLWVDRQLPPGAWRLAHRLQGIGWHLLVTGLVVASARRAGVGTVAAVSAGAVFALHPAQVGAVQFVAARNDLMATALLLLAAARVPREGWRGLGGIATLCSAAVLSKESAALAPLILGVLALCGGGGLRRAAGVGLAGAVGVGVAVGLRLAVGVSFPGGAAPGAMLAALGPAVGHWAAVLAWPVGLAPDVNLTWPEAVPISAALAGAALALGVALAGGRRGGAWMLGAGLVLAPALAGVAANGLVPDRYLYGPLAFGGVALALALGRLPPRAAGLVGAGLAAACAIQTHRTLPIWSSDLALWRAGVAAHPQPFTWAAYGAALAEAGLLPEAARLTEAAATGRPPMPHACFNVTRLHLRAGAPGEAVRAGRAALEAGCPATAELLAPMAVGQLWAGDVAAAEATAAQVGADPTGQAVLVRCAAAAIRGDLSVLAATAAGGRGEPRALQAQVAFLLRGAGEEAAALAVEAAPLGSGSGGGEGAGVLPHGDDRQPHGDGEHAGGRHEGR